LFFVKYNIRMKKELLELQEKIDFLQNFANVNSGNEIGQNLYTILEFSQNYLNKLKEENERELELKGKKSLISRI